MKTKFIFIRHAQSVAKERGVVQGEGKMFPLSKLGEEQARRLGKALKGMKFDRLFTSTSVRAVKTAEEIKKFHHLTPCEEVALLHERSKGDAQGMPQADFAKMYPDVLAEWAREEDPRPADGESFADVEKRVMPVILGHLHTFPGQVLLYVIHGNVIRNIIGALLEISPGKRHRIAQDYCGITTIEFDSDKNRWRVISVNEHVI